MRRSRIKKLLLQGELYGITDFQYSGEDNIQAVRELIAGGIKIIQYREKGRSKGVMYEELIAIRKMTKEHDVLLIVNDHVDLCQMVQADGVHVGQKDLPAEAVRKLLGEDYIVGLSTHNETQGRAALTLPVDYIGVGPTYTTTTKNITKVAGLDYAGFAARELDVPQVAIGGITEERLPEVKARGVKSVCMIGDLLTSENITAKVKRIRTILNGSGQ